MQQMFQLGEYFRRRYESILPPDVNPVKLVYAQSTDLDRTLMSAASFMAGLFPPTKEQIWNKNIRWQPVSIHTMPAKVDFVLSTTIGKRCDRYEFLKQQHYNRTEYKEWHSKHQKVYEYIESKSGVSADDPWNLMILYDTLRIHQMKDKK